MAIPSIPQNFIVQQGNGDVYLSWDITAGATSYSVQRSTDGVTYSSLGTASVNDYTDTTAALETLYYYKVASVNSSGTSPYTGAQTIVAVPVGEMSLGGIRLAAQQTADRVGSNFVSTSEWNSFINLAMFELYDLLTTTYEDYKIADPLTITTDGSTTSFPLPNGSNYDGAEPFYKLTGADLAVNTASNAYVTLHKFNFADRNKYVYPNTTSTIYGVYNLRYRLVGKNIQFIPTPSAGQQIRLWYVPRLRQLLKDTDTTDIGTSGWLRYVIVRAAKYALDKEESDTTKQDSELLFLKKRIEETAPDRDAGMPDTVSDTRSSGGYDGGFGSNGSGPNGGW